jgi:hypothetical protein
LAFADPSAAVAFTPLLLAIALVPINGTVNAATAITSTTINAARFIFIVCPSPSFRKFWKIQKSVSSGAGQINSSTASEPPVSPLTQVWD